MEEDEACWQGKRGKVSPNASDWESEPDGLGVRTRRTRKNNCFFLLHQQVGGASGTFFFQQGNVKAERTEPVVAADHCAHGVLHPAVVEVAFTSGERLHKRSHRLPRRGAQSLRTFSIDGDPLLALPDITGVFDRILVFCHQIRIDRLANGCNLDFHLVRLVFFCLCVATCSSSRYEAVFRHSLHVLLDDGFYMLLHELQGIGRKRFEDVVVQQGVRTIGIG